MINDHFSKNLSGQTPYRTNGNPSDKNNADYKKDLPYALKMYLRRKIEAELFSAHKTFIKCSNHLHEFKWLTKNEIDNQHEYYPYRESFLERISTGLVRRRRTNIPKTREVAEYIKDLKEQISLDIEKRLQTEHEINEKIRKKRQSMVKNLQDEKKDDTFKRSHPDYRLYENHLGETRWMTPQEFESQDEFTLEVIPLSKKITKAALWLVPSIVLLIIVILLLDMNRGPVLGKGYLLVQSNIPQGQIYIDEKLRLGVSLNQPFLLSEGSYRITYRKTGFNSFPPAQNITINIRDTTKVQFVLAADQNDEIAIVRLNSTLPDAKVFVNNDFYGIVQNNPQLSLAPGDYRIALKKENYTTIPPFADISLNKGDSISLPFAFSERTISRIRKEQIYGLIEVRSNVPDAKIYLNGSYSGFNTDYIFNKVPLGSYTVSIQLSGFSVEPGEKTVNLTAGSPHQVINFSMRRSELPITFKTVPVKGDIFLDGEKLGSGEWRGVLSPGRYQLTFGTVNYFEPPAATTLSINETSPGEYTFRYLPIYKIEFNPDGILPEKEYGTIQLGYTDEDNVFYSDPKNAPEITKTEGFSQKVWLMGYAFAYRNPPENDAIQFSFNIPSTVDLSRNLWLKMWGYRTDENYPMEFSSVSEIRISVNNRMIQEDYTPEFGIEQGGNSRFEQFRINNLLRHGKNRILISTGPLNTTFFALWKIAIE